MNLGSAVLKRLPRFGKLLVLEEPEHNYRDHEPDNAGKRALREYADGCIDIYQ